MRSEDLVEDLEKLRMADMSPIAVSEMMGYNVFVYETQEEADEAWRKFKHLYRTNDRSAWWYGLDEFVTAYKELQEDAKEAVKAGLEE